MSVRFELEVAIFNAARRLTAEKRTAFVEKACAADAALRQRVEELLRSDDEAGTFLEDGAPGAQRVPND